MSLMESGKRRTGIPGSGSLYVVSTPIGNLGDISFRAVETLKTVDLIAAEDTRRASIVTRKYEIVTKRISYHEHNANRRIPELLRFLNSGKNAALITNAGTPGISDPGFKLIRRCIENEIPVISVPGPAAFLTALVVSGLPTNRFVFEGFLPVKKGRNKRLRELAQENRTVILYESPHRIVRTVGNLLEYMGDRKVVFVREITKYYEEIVRTTLSDAAELFKKRKPKGEYVIILHGCSK